MCCFPVLVLTSTARSKMNSTVEGRAFVQRNGRLFRPVQDCRAGYGTGIGLTAVLIDVLTTPRPPQYGQFS